MPFTAAQLAVGADYTLNSYDSAPPEDQINTVRPILDWLIKNSTFSSFGNGFHQEGVYVTNDSNYQNYWGADAVTYNERDPVDWAKYPWYNNHDGFWFDEDRLMANGITITEDESEAVPTAMEKERLVDLLKISHTALKNSILDGMALELMQTGLAGNGLQCPGLAHLIATTPTNIVGGIDSNAKPYWKNNTSIAIPLTAGSLVPEIDIMWRAAQLYGGSTPNAFFAGQKFLAHYRKEANLTVNRSIQNGGVIKGGVSIDPSTNDVYYMGLLVVWDPVFEKLDLLLGGDNWTRTAYMINGNYLKLRKLKNNWMRKRRPRRLPDRYVHYWGQTSKYAMTTNKRNAQVVLRVNAV